MAEDLLENGTAVSGDYNAAEIQVLEGMEAVRKRPSNAVTGHIGLNGSL